jgi:hypothetical protein
MVSPMDTYFLNFLSNLGLKAYWIGLTCNKLVWVHTVAKMYNFIITFVGLAWLALGPDS